VPFNLPNLPNLFAASPASTESGGGEDPSDNGKLQTYHERKILPYSQKQLYELITDIDSYHRFVPFCTSSKVLRTSNESTRIDASRDGPSLKKKARLTVGFLAFSESYDSLVTCRPYSSVEAVACSDTPLFNALNTTWRFQPASPSSPHPSTIRTPYHNDVRDEGPTLVSIDLQYSFTTSLYASVSAAFFKQVSQMMVSAFEKRCVEVYGPGVK